MVSPDGVHINCTNNDGYTPLHIAALHGHVSLVNMFLKRGANVNARTKKHGCTPLHLACQNNRLRVREVKIFFVTHVVFVTPWPFGQKGYCRCLHLSLRPLTLPCMIIITDLSWNHQICIKHAFREYSQMVLKIGVIDLSLEGHFGSLTHNARKFVLSTNCRHAGDTTVLLSEINRQVSNIRRTKSKHLKDSCTVLRVSLLNPLKPDVKSRMKM